MLPPQLIRGRCYTNRKLCHSLKRPATKSFGESYFGKAKAKFYTGLPSLEVVKKTFDFVSKVSRIACFSGIATHCHIRTLHTVLKFLLIERTYGELGHVFQHCFGNKVKVIVNRFEVFVDRPTN